MKIMHTFLLMAMSAFAYSQTQYSLDSNGEKTNPKNALVIAFIGDVDKKIKTLNKDQGRVDILKENISGKDLRITNIKRFGLLRDKLVITMMVVSNGDKHLISITCSDEYNSSDYLIPNTREREMIVEYFYDLFDIH